MKRPELLTKVNEIVDLDKQSRSLKQELDSIRSSRNKLSQEVNKLKKEDKDASEVLKQVKELPKKLKKKEEEYDRVQMSLKLLAGELPNLIHEKVPYGKGEEDNVEYKTWGKKPEFDFPVKNHVELLEGLDLVDFETAGEVSGKGFYYLKGDFALLNQALIRFVIDFMYLKDYTYVEPPLVIRKGTLSATLDVDAFNETIYQLDGTDQCLIGTSEHTLLAMHKDEVLEKLEGNPKKYFAYTMCFRQEIGAHGINEKGIWRTHQFNKVEQLIFCSVEDSWKMFDELLQNKEEIMQSLKLPYRVTEVCTGDLSRWKARQNEVEIWRPTTEAYAEIGSLSNCTDYQTRGLNIRYDGKDGRKVVHALNNTAIATSRILVGIVEHYQQKDGSIKVPNVLVPYMHGIKVIKKK